MTAPRQAAEAEAGAESAPDGSASPSPEHTPDGRYLVIDGRKWRASDPGIPEKLRAELVAELMRARRLVRTDPASARPCVHDAKVALGERGTPWWEPTTEGTRERIAATIRALLRHRAGSSICPSDVARVVCAAQWRDLMPQVRSVAANLVGAGHITVSRKGEPVDPLAGGGPIRLNATSSLPGRPPEAKE